MMMRMLMMKMVMLVMLTLLMLVKLIHIHDMNAAPLTDSMYLGISSLDCGIHDDDGGDDNDSHLVSVWALISRNRYENSDYDNYDEDNGLLWT